MYGFSGRGLTDWHRICQFKGFFYAYQVFFRKDQELFQKDAELFQNAEGIFPETPASFLGYVKLAEVIVRHRRHLLLFFFLLRQKKFFFTFLFFSLLYFTVSEVVLIFSALQVFFEATLGRMSFDPRLNVVRCSPDYCSCFVL